MTRCLFKTLLLVVAFALPGCVNWQPAEGETHDRLVELVETHEATRGETVEHIESVMVSEEGDRAKVEYGIAWRPEHSLFKPASGRVAAWCDFERRDIGRDTGGDAGGDAGRWAITRRRTTVDRRGSIGVGLGGGWYW